MDITGKWSIENELSWLDRFIEIECSNEIICISPD